MHWITKPEEEFEALTAAEKSQEKFERRRIDSKADEKVRVEEKFTRRSNDWDNAENDSDVTAAIKDKAKLNYTVYCDEGEEKFWENSCCLFYVKLRHRNA